MDKIDLARVSLGFGLSKRQTLSQEKSLLSVRTLRAEGGGQPRMGVEGREGTGRGGGLGVRLWRNVPSLS